MIKNNKREILFSIIIALIAFAIGVFVNNWIIRSAVKTAEVYATSTIIKDSRQFRYGMDTNFGNSLIYGELSADSPVSFEEIPGGYICIKKTKERYTMHNRTVTTTDSKGKSHTRVETYWSWDYVDHEARQAKTIRFLGNEFASDAIALPFGRLDLKKAGVEDCNGNYIYENSVVRYRYEVSHNNLIGIVFANLRDGTIHDQSRLYLDEDPTQVIASKQSSLTVSLVVFWVVWALLTAAVIFGFICMDNHWLN